MEQFSFEMDDGSEFEISPQNTFGFVHQHPEDADFDHIFFMTGQDEEGNPVGKYMWRDKCEDLDAAVEQLEDLDYVVFHPERVAEEDRTAYFRTHPAELKIVALTMRMGHRVDFLGYLLQHDHLTPDDFLRDGELYI